MAYVVPDSSAMGSHKWGTTSSTRIKFYVSWRYSVAIKPTFSVTILNGILGNLPPVATDLHGNSWQIPWNLHMELLQRTQGKNHWHTVLVAYFVIHWSEMQYIYMHRSMITDVILIPSCYFTWANCKEVIKNRSKWVEQCPYMVMLAVPQ